MGVLSMPPRKFKSGRYCEQLSDTTEKNTSHAEVESNRIRKYGIDAYYRENPQKYKEAVKASIDSIDFSNERKGLLSGVNLYEENTIKAKPYAHTDPASCLVKKFLGNRDTDMLRTICERIGTDSVGLDEKDDAIEAMGYFIGKYKSMSSEDELQSLSFQHYKDQLEDAIRGNDRLQWAFSEYLRQDVYQGMPSSEKVLFDKGLVITDSRIMGEIKFDNREYIFHPQEIRLEAWRNRETSGDNGTDALIGMGSMWSGARRSHDLKELRNFVISYVKKEFKEYYIKHIIEHSHGGQPDAQTQSMLTKQEISINEWSTFLNNAKKFLETGEESMEFPFKIQIHYPHLEEKLENLRVLERVESEPKRDDIGNVLMDKKNNIRYQDKEDSITEFYATNEPVSLWEKIEGKSFALAASESKKTKKKYNSKINIANLNSVFNYNKVERSVIEREGKIQVARWYLKDDESLQFDNIRILLDYRPNCIGRATIVADAKNAILHISQNESNLSLFMTDNRDEHLLKRIRTGYTPSDNLKIYI
jgi:hypothetical protein